jgi:hypothetical protein
MNELMTSLARPENAVFVVPAIVAVLFAVLQVVGGGLDAAAGHGHGFDVAGHGHAHGLGGHVHAHGHAHTHAHDPHHPHDHAHHGPHSHEHPHPRPGLAQAVLLWLNVGKAPLMIVLEVLLLAFGIFGVLGADALRARGAASGWPATAITFVPALALAAFVAKGAGAAIARTMPTFETKGMTARSLVGTTAEVASEEVTAEAGRASARDAAGDLYTVFCRLAPGATPAKKGERVVLVDYVADGDRYTVKPVASDPAAAPKP